MEKLQFLLLKLKINQLIFKIISNKSRKIIHLKKMEKITEILMIKIIHINNILI